MADDKEVKEVEREILHTKELAEYLGRSVYSIRNAVYDKSPWLPPYFKQGPLLCWRLSTVRKFIAQQEEHAINPPKKRGRPRKAPR